MAFQISLGIIAIAPRDNDWYLDRGVDKFPVTPLAARSECESRFPKVFEEVADLPWHTRKPTLLGQARNSNFATIWQMCDG